MRNHPALFYVRQAAALTWCESALQTRQGELVKVLRILGTRFARTISTHYGFTELLKEKISQSRSNNTEGKSKVVIDTGILISAFALAGFQKRLLRRHSDPQKYMSPLNY